MTIATYAFLVEICDPEENDAKISREVIATFLDFTDRCDENNWHRAGAVVLRSGRVICLRENDDYPGHDALVKHLSQVPEAQRWEYARLLALQCVANDFELGGRSRFGVPTGDEAEILPEEWNGFDVLLQRILSEMPGRLAQLWGRGSLVNIGLYDDDYSTRISRAEWSNSMNKVLDSIFLGHPPFAYEGGPYEYRAFVLCSDPERANAILFVDIHT